MLKLETARLGFAGASVRYLLAALSVGAALAVTLMFQPSQIVTVFFFPAILLSTWFFGGGPGLLAVLLSTLAVNYFFLPPTRAVMLGLHDIPHLFAFLLSALLVSSFSTTRNRAERDLRQARDELETKVQERTADLRQSNEELRIQAEELNRQAQLLDTAHDAIIVRNLADRITFWNRAAAERYGWTSSEALGKVTHDLLRTEFPRPLKDIVEELRLMGFWEGELVHYKRDGSRIVVASRQVAQNDENGRPLAILEINNDITSRKLAEEALRKTHSELAHVTRVLTMGELASSIAHEVNQPLAAVVANGNACLRWIAGETPNLDEARECIKRIIRDGNRASEVIVRIRAMMKKSPQDMTVLDLNETIQEVLPVTSTEAHRNNVSLRTELAAGLPAVRGDRVQLQQVILNLVLNGIEAMGAITDGPRELVITSRRDESDKVLVAVQDSGVGLSLQSAEHIFDAFYSTKPAGMGMGLSISRSIIQAHGGRLWATPNGSRGSTFQFTVPIAP